MFTNRLRLPSGAKAACVVTLVLTAVVLSHGGCSKSTPSCKTLKRDVNILYEEITERQSNGMRPSEDLALALLIESHCEGDLSAKQRRCVHDAEKFAQLRACVPALAARAYAKKQVAKEPTRKRPTPAPRDAAPTETEATETSENRIPVPLKVTGTCHLRVVVSSRSKTVKVSGDIAVGRWGKRCSGLLTIECKGAGVHLWLGTNLFSFVDAKGDKVLKSGQNMKYEIAPAAKPTQMFVHGRTRLLGKGLDTLGATDTPKATGSVSLGVVKDGLRADVNMRAKAGTGQRVLVRGHVKITCPKGANCRARCP